MPENRPAVPISLSVITFLLIITGTMAFLNQFAVLFSPELMKLQYGSNYIAGAILLLAGTSIPIISGIAMLYYKNWGRHLYLLSTLFILGLQFIFGTELAKYLILLNIPYFAVILFFLYRPRVNEFFAQERTQDSSTWLPLVFAHLKNWKMKRWFSIPFFMSSLFMLLLGLFFLSQMQSTGIAFFIQLFLFSIPFFILHGIGVSLWESKCWSFSLSIIFTIAGSMLLTLGLGFWIMPQIDFSDIVTLPLGAEFYNLYLSALLFGGMLLVIAFLLYQLQLEDHKKSQNIETESA